MRQQTLAAETGTRSVVLLRATTDVLWVAAQTGTFHIMLARSAPSLWVATITETGILMFEGFLIRSLFLARGPTNVARFVVPSVTNAVYAVTGRRPWT